MLFKKQFKSSSQLIMIWCKNLNMLLLWRKFEMKFSKIILIRYILYLFDWCEEHAIQVYKHTHRCIQTYSRLIVPFNYFVNIWSERKFHRNSCALTFFTSMLWKIYITFISNYCGTHNKTCIQEYTNIFFIPHIVYFSHKNCLPELYISFHW